MAGALLLVTGGGVALGSGPAVAAAAQPNARVPAGCAATAAAGLTGDDGKPYMSIRTTYDDHDDLLVNAGLATAEMRT